MPVDASDYLGIPGARKEYVETSVGRAAYIVAGGTVLGNDPAGPRVDDTPPIVLLHGLGATSETWYRTIRVLAADHLVIAPDLWGHGESDGPVILRKVEPIVVALEALMLSLGFSRAVVVGHSLGGLVAGRFALTHPERVAKLVLVDAGGIGGEMSWLLKLASIPVIGWLVFSPAALVVKLYGGWVFSPPDHVHIGLLKSLHHSRLNHVSAGAVRRAVRSGAKRVGSEEAAYILPRLGEIEVPVLILWGEQDRLFPVRQVGWVKEAFPEVETHVFPDVGHWPYAEVSEEFNRRLVDFVGS